MQFKNVNVKRFCKRKVVTVPLDGILDTDVVDMVNTGLANV